MAATVACRRRVAITPTVLPFNVLDRSAFKWYAHYQRDYASRALFITLGGLRSHVWRAEHARTYVRTQQTCQEKNVFGAALRYQ